MDKEESLDAGEKSPVSSSVVSLLLVSMEAGSVEAL
eukprot:CAMPEP_0201248066 /NCGR_PEP_ID=MMETSP0852-20130820/55570_1 /ASSEMBLY_ACC=CAM_ASM_000632 /TAXON_ID=183588 /ORGANISM="Pseudo-nitzschia fraudulenta, Strain WWA7" /LENGTH=35 /DNA_ID= /DNA_START= /DNA_END= /DNA_ORIENTATION=